MGYRSMVTELAGPTLAWLAIQAIAYCIGGGVQRPIRSGGSMSNPYPWLAGTALNGYEKQRFSSNMVCSVSM